MYIQNLVENDPVVSEKSKFQFLYVNNLGPRSRNDLDLQYSYAFINLISYMHLQNFRPLAAIVLRISTVFPFTYIEKPRDSVGSKMTRAISRKL